MTSALAYAVAKSWAWPGWWAPGAAVMESLFGMERFDSGEVLIDGAPVTIDSPSVAIEKGMALLTEDRKKSGLFLVLSVLENMSIVKMPEYIGKSGFVQHVKMAEDCMEQIRRLNIKTPTMDQIINNLSGGISKSPDCALAVSATENLNSR